MIEAFFGLPGSGKTYTLVKKLYDNLSKKHNRQKRLFSNMHIEEEHIRKLTEWEGELIYLHDIEDLIDAHNGIMLLDELNLWAPSRVWNKVPEKLLHKWAQVRKSGLQIWFTSQSPNRVDKVIREIIFESNYMTSFKMLGFFSCRTYAGIKHKFTSFSMVRFKKKVANIYDTEAFIDVPEYYSKDKKDIKPKIIEEKNPNQWILEEEKKQIENRQKELDFYINWSKNMKKLRAG